MEFEDYDVKRHRYSSAARLERLIAKLDGDEPIDIQRTRATIYALSVQLQFINSARNDDLDEMFAKFEESLNELKNQQH
jgi:hypothetical protein